MNLRSLLNKKNISLNLNIESKKRLVELFANRLATNYENVEEDNVLSNLYKRERIGSTYIGKNIYMPHCKVDGLITTKIVIFTLKNSYYDDSVDDHIKTAVGVFFPHKTSEIHTELLKQLAHFFKKTDILDNLEQIKDIDTLFKLIIKDSDND
ncbi:PTS sugar transporter subunit IIA [Francisella adeliensis]|uniref:PTS N-acetyl-D-glucosamine transporter n=1 Tax=Francisella adeliensis TaxID=2007306 RepID=A0A2Z4XXX0_9GAMM|nr:PTS sugar transporter subunit IIA [Francisella adeliensis]AXA33629.1 PTS N-acetyl-D-glucosamine transporter [Francisella adeliensis]MBK2085126.1 PTS sugar transporter subunit IIA [Francisella adeliensis]MBK2097397.1 PTS sugar transporter subunit IIA [Francisella adeliensis]QIW11863.1 PTS sugar transporter subunit IIA [Francisella adeliensis]QIW13739.1 PTS sugar transporter subunit IIA [Francisella adeliensis]